MQAIETALPGVLILEPTIFRDERGFFFESYNRRRLQEHTGYDGDFVQDNHSRSRKHVLRGLHYQIRQPQGKLVRVIEGEVFDVAVDIRRSSPNFGKWVGVHQSAQNRKMLWVPAGFAHGFVVVSEACEVLYKTTDYWAPAHERCIQWNDPALGIDWPLSGEPVMSAKDMKGTLLAQAEVYP
jgi:dTDP-4-dehydrorhamnose 3,5-epimerase